MKHARPDYQRFQDPEGKIPSEEPVFLLRGQDIIAAELVDKWAEENERRGGDRGLTESARRHAALMRAWPVRRLATP